MASGLLWVWASAAVALFMLYILFSFLTPVVGVIDTAITGIMGDVPMEESWHEMYNRWVPYLRDFFGYLSIGLFISIIIYVILHSARREPNEYYLPY